MMLNSPSFLFYYLMIVHWRRFSTNHKTVRIKSFLASRFRVYCIQYRHVNRPRVSVLIFASFDTKRFKMVLKKYNKSMGRLMQGRAPLRKKSVLLMFSHSALVLIKVPNCTAHPQKNFWINGSR